MAKHSALSDTSRAILQAAAEHPDHLAIAPIRLPVAAQRSVLASIIKSGLLEEIAAATEEPAWRTDEGTRHALKASEKGLRAIGTKVDDDGQVGGSEMPSPPPAPAAEDASAPIPASGGRVPLRSAARSVMTAWDSSAEGCTALEPAMDASRCALNTRRAPGSPAGPRQPRPDTKRASIVALLRRPAGATVAQVVEATGWARHTVHGFFAGLKKAGTRVEVMERVRQVGPGKQGAAGCFSIYRISEEG